MSQFSNIRFMQKIGRLWEKLKKEFPAPEQARLRTVLKSIIEIEDAEFAEFVNLMKVNGEIAHVANADDYYAPANTIAEELQRYWDNKREDDEAPCTYQCHYCGDMCELGDLRGSKMGLICYKCETEKTADPNDPNDFLD
jgi:hypothetical protein